MDCDLRGRYAKTRGSSKVGVEIAAAVPEVMHLLQNCHQAVSKYRSLPPPFQEPEQPTSAEGHMTWGYLLKGGTQTASDCSNFPQVSPHTPIVSSKLHPLPSLTEQVIPSKQLLLSFLLFGQGTDPRGNLKAKVGPKSKLSNQRSRMKFTP